MMPILKFVSKRIIIVKRRLKPVVEGLFILLSMK